ncbi:MAG: ATP-binding protein, partial [Candidatus Aminicenantia bacterium]
SDSKEVFGVNIGKDTIEKLTNKITNNTDPVIYPSIEILDVEGKNLIVLELEECKNKPYLAFGRAFKRVGKSTVQMSRDEFERLILEKRKVYFDAEICEDAKLEDIDLDKVKWYLEQRELIRGVKKPEKMNIEQVLLSIEAIKKIDGKIKVTNAGVLFFCKNPQKFIPYAVIRCARFRDKLMRNFIDQATYHGTIPEEIENAVKFVEKNIKLGGTRDLGIRRIDRFEYPIAVIREAITNALAHRDYFSLAEVRVAVFDDMIKIFNPGGFPRGFDLKNPTHVPRNRILCNLLYDVGYIEKWGSGILMMQEEMIKWGLKEPAFEDKKLELVTILHGAGDEIIENIAVSEKYGKVLLWLNERQRALLKYLEKYRKITKKEYLELFKVSRTTATKDLKDLVEKNIILQKGKGRGSYFTPLK